MFGTHSQTDLLSVTTSIATFGESDLALDFAAELAAHNGIVANMLGDLCSFGSEQIAGYGGTNEMVAYDVDEFGQSDAQKPGVPTTIGFPSATTT